MVRGLICFGTLYWRHAEGGGNRLFDVFMLLLLPLVAYLLGMDDAESLGISVLGAIGSSFPKITLYVLGRTLLEMLPRYDSETGVVNADPTITIDTKSTNSGTQSVTLTNTNYGFIMYTQSQDDNITSDALCELKLYIDII